MARISDATARVINAHQQRLDRAALPSPVAPGVDRTGAPPMHGPAGLAQAEANAWRRLSPRRNRWADINKFDQRVAELEQRRAEVSADLAQLHQRRQDAPHTDAERIAGWELDGRKGPRPEPHADAIDTKIRQRQTDVDGLDLAIAQVLDDKTRYVERHRGRLVKDADHAVTAAHARLHELLDQVIRARDKLLEHRHDSLWSALYPDATAGVEAPQHHMLAGGLRRPLEQTLGITHQLQANRVIDALRADADWVKDAATPEQRALLEGRNPKRPNSDATWAGTPEAIEQERAEKQAALARYREMWGRDPA